MLNVLTINGPIWLIKYEFSLKICARSKDDNTEFLPSSTLLLSYRIRKVNDICQREIRIKYQKRFKGGKNQLINSTMKYLLNIYCVSDTCDMIPDL